MNKFWIICDSDKDLEATNCFGRLERDGKITVLSSIIHGPVSYLVIISDLNRDVMDIAVAESGAVVRFTTPEGYDEFCRGFALGFKFAISER